MPVSGSCFETSHKTPTAKRINVADKCFCVKHPVKTFLGVSDDFDELLIEFLQAITTKEKCTMPLSNCMCEHNVFKIFPFVGVHFTRILVKLN